MLSTSAYTTPFGEPNLDNIQHSKMALVNICIERLPFLRKTTGTTPVARGTVAADVFAAATAHEISQYSGFWQSGINVGGWIGSFLCLYLPSPHLIRQGDRCPLLTNTS